MFKENHQQVGQLATELLTMKEYIGTFYEIVLKCQRNQGIGVNFLAEQEPFVEVLFQMCGIISLHEDQPPVVMISLSGVEAIDNPHNEIKSQCFNILTVLLWSATVNNAVKFIESNFKYLTYYILTLQDFTSRENYLELIDEDIVTKSIICSVLGLLQVSADYTPYG